MENGIKERKRKRRRFIAVCVPLCLCVVLYAGLLLPGMLPTEEMADCAQNELAADYTDGEQIPFVSVEIVNASNLIETCSVSDDMEQIRLLYTRLGDLFEEPASEVYDGGAVPKTEADDEADGAPLTSNIAHPKYMITFNTAYAGLIVYEINGNRLICYTDNRETVLTHGDLMGLIGELTLISERKEHVE